MPLEIIRNDITTMSVDAIVNPSNRQMFGISGVDGKIHSLIGPKLREETSQLGICQPGQVKLTSAYQLPADYIIHTVGPIWVDGLHGEEKVLEDCYLNALELSVQKQFESIAFPLIASGTYGYPKDQALRTAINIIGQFLMSHDLLVYLVVYDEKAFKLSEKLFSKIESYIDDHYVDQDTHYIERNTHRHEYGIFSNKVVESRLVPAAAESSRSLEDVLSHMDLTFSEMLIQLIDEKGYMDSDVYKRANVDRRLFSKIKNNKNYQTSKKTALSFAIALKLNLDETMDLLLKAGYALSNSSRLDLVIKYFIEEEDYNIFRINEVLFGMGLNTLV